MGRVKDKEKKQVVKKSPKKVKILSKENFELTLSHSFVCRVDQKCTCTSRIKDGVFINTPASIHVVKGIVVEVPEVLLREKNGVLVKKIKLKIAKVVK